MLMAPFAPPAEHSSDSRYGACRGERARYQRAAGSLRAVRARGKSPVQPGAVQGRKVRHQSEKYRCLTERELFS